jgi:hypothetical protein
MAAPRREAATQSSHARSHLTVTICARLRVGMARGVLKQEAAKEAARGVSRLLSLLSLPVFCDRELVSMGEVAGVTFGSCSRSTQESFLVTLEVEELISLMGRNRKAHMHPGCFPTPDRVF